MSEYYNEGVEKLLKGVLSHKFNDAADMPPSDELQRMFGQFDSELQREFFMVSQALELEKQGVTIEFGKLGLGDDKPETIEEFEKEYGDALKALQSAPMPDDDDDSPAAEAARKARQKAMDELHDRLRKDIEGGGSNKSGFGGPNDPHSPEYTGSDLVDRLWFGISDKDTYLNVRGSGEISDKQLRRMILRAVLKNDFKELYFYKDGFGRRPRIDGQLAMRANMMIGEFARSKNPALKAAFADENGNPKVQASSVSMRELEPFRSSFNIFARADKFFENMGRDRQARNSQAKAEKTGGLVREATIPHV